MLRLLHLAFVLLMLATGGPGVAHAAPVKTAHVEAELVSEKTAFVPGQPTTVALRLKMADGWHTYWQNPGDSGLPTTIAWTLPPDMAVGPIQWPTPHALPVGPLVNFGYEGEVLLPIEMQVPANAVPGTTRTLNAKAEWLVCRETCIPEEATLQLVLPVAERADVYPQWGSAIAAARAALPAPAKGWLFEAKGEGNKVIVTATAPAGAPAPGNVYFFPFQEGRIEPAGKQTFVRDANGTFVLTLPVAYQLAADFKRVSGVLTASKGLAVGDGLVAATTIDVALTGAVVAGPKPVDASVAAATFAAPKPAVASLSLWLAIVFAFVGGVVLNLMPCVFPVLSLKVLSLSSPGHEDVGRLRMQGLAFGAGVVVTFVALAGLLLAFRAAGEQLGWGFQLQSPAVVSALAILFFVLALNLSGVFEFALLVPSSAAGWNARNPYVNAALSGGLAVVIASPCTAPFMGAALGFALAQPAALTLLVFVALGLGMAMPFVLLTWFPGWRRMLPKPGAWMERMKQFLAFPLYATVAWLVWVLGAQVDNDAVVRLLVTLVVLAFALWAWRAYRGGGGRAWSAAGIAGFVAAAYVVSPLFGPTTDKDMPTPQARTTIGAVDLWQPYTPAKLDELTADGKPVFVDFTAAWCVTCQVNKLVLNDPGITGEFARRGVQLVRADWTRRDPAITRALAGFGRQGVPVYVLYRPGKEPMLLPEVLQKQTVLDALATL